MSIINEFLVEGGIYYHNFSLINDSNLLCDFDGNPLILYTRNGTAHDVRGKDTEFLKLVEENIGNQIGFFKIDENDHWTFIFKENGDTIIGLHSAGGNSLLDTEVLVSKAIIAKWFPIGNEEGE